jgi:uncharacterized membrane protein YiaA
LPVLPPGAHCAGEHRRSRRHRAYRLPIRLLYGLFAAISLQKSVRDRSEGIHVTGLYFGLCWLSLCAVVLLLSVGLWNAALAPSEKGFYAMSFVLSLFAVVAVQKNVCDLAWPCPRARRLTSVQPDSLRRRIKLTAARAHLEKGASVPICFLVKNTH